MNEERGGELGSLNNETDDVLFVNLDWICIPEWWKSSQELIDQDTQRPPVNGSGMALTLNDFRGQVFRGAAQRVGFPLALVNITVEVRPLDIRPLPRPAESADERRGSYCCLAAWQSRSRPA